MTQCVKGKLDIQRFLENIGRQRNRRQHPMKTLFIQRGIEKRSVAKALNVSQGLISKIFSGKVQPTKTLEMNLQALAMIIEEFDIDGFEDGEKMKSA
jgi:transcriptional regulator with XRE-family HTH domain